jgi:hypothetical protein
MADRFVHELEAIAGQVRRSATMDDARRHLAELLDEENWATIAAMDHPLCRDLTSQLAPERVDWDSPDGASPGLTLQGGRPAGARSHGHSASTDVPTTVPESRDLARLPASLIAADTLLADTGTCMIACATPRERLLCYLPPVCIIVATTAQLAEHMPAAWDAIATRTADPELRGEFVFITGPSRTADIEKILILGVHGPKRLIVLLVG